MRVSTFLGKLGFDSPVSLEPLERLEGVPLPSLIVFRDIEDAWFLLRPWVPLRYLPIGVVHERYALFLDLLQLAEGQLVVTRETDAGHLDLASSIAELLEGEFLLMARREWGASAVRAVQRLLKDRVPGWSLLKGEGDARSATRLWRHGYRSTRMFRAVMAECRTTDAQRALAVSASQGAPDNRFMAHAASRLEAGVGDLDAALSHIARALRAPYRADPEGPGAAIATGRLLHAKSLDSGGGQVARELHGWAHHEERIVGLEAGGRVAEAYQVVENKALVTGDIRPYLGTHGRLIAALSCSVPGEALVALRHAGLKTVVHEVSQRSRRRASASVEPVRAEVLR